VGRPKVLNLLAFDGAPPLPGAAAGNGPSFPKDGLYVGANVPITFVATCKQAAGTQFALLYYKSTNTSKSK
jgi:hypothetical protein